MKVLITAGTVYGKLDDNKLVGNRIRGIWASKFAAWLHARNHEVTLLLPDTFDKTALAEQMGAEYRAHRGPVSALFHRRTHSGYESYAEQCYELAPQVDAAVMAAAVVNWIPKEPIKGKMKTEGFAEGDTINVPFMLAPRVIDRMRKLNRRLTLVGCKMTSGASPEETYRQAYQTLLKAHCNVVVANDLHDLKSKSLVYPDGSQVRMSSFEHLYGELETLLHDQFYQTIPSHETVELPAEALAEAVKVFDHICDQYRVRFVGPRGTDRVFGSIAVRIDDRRALVSPREKGSMFSSKDAVIVEYVDTASNFIVTRNEQKATLNAPLLFRVLQKFAANAVVHLHENNPEWPSYPYAPPGSVRDNNRTLISERFNIIGHGCVFVWG